MAPASVRNRASAGGGVPAAAVTMDPAGGGGGAYYQQQSGLALRKPSITVTRFNSEEGGIDRSGNDEADAESEIDAALPPRQPREQQVKWIRQNFFRNIHVSNLFQSEDSQQQQQSPRAEESPLGSRSLSRGQSMTRCSDS